MSATLTDPRPSVTMTARNGRLRERLAGLERPLLVAGLALVALHPAAYERRTTAFLDQALGLKETS